MNHISGWFSSISQQLASPLSSTTAEENQKNTNVEIKNDSIENHKSDDGAKVDGDDKNAAKMFGFIKSGNYANKFVDSVNSLANKIVHAKPEDLKHFFDAKQMLKELEEENEKFAAEKSSIQQNQASSTMITTTATSEPVWRGCAEETLAKKQILSLSFDSRNFLSDPPPEQSDFPFDYDTNVNLAVIMLNEDPNLRKMRFQLVPKVISEVRFWRNYFYRISLVKQSIALKSMVDREHKDSASPDVEEIQPSSSNKVDSQLNEDEQGNKKSDERVENLLSPSTVEFLSDATSLPDNDPGLMTARQELGILSAESSPPLKRKPDNSQENWENDLLSELNDYELINNGSNVNQIRQQKEENNDWEEEIDDLLKK